MQDEITQKHIESASRQDEIWEEESNLAPFKKLFMNFWVWPVLILFAYGSLNYSGFCFKKMRYLSDDEKIRMAISYINRATYFYNIEGAYYSNGRPNRYQKTVPSESIDLFLQQNPNCCTLIPKNGGYYDDPAPTFWMRVFGKFNYGVRVKYVKRYIEGPLDEKGKEGKGQVFEKLSETFVSAGNCGDYCVSCFADGGKGFSWF